MKNILLITPPNFISKSDPFDQTIARSVANTRCHAIISGVAKPCHSTGGGMTVLFYNATMSGVKNKLFLFGSVLDVHCGVALLFATL